MWKCNKQIVLALTYNISSSPVHQNLDLTKKTLVHEGPLSWKVKDKTIGL